MAQDEILTLIALLWLIVSTLITLDVERHTARRLARPMRRWIVVLSIIGLALGAFALLLFALDAWGLLS